MTTQHFDKEYPIIATGNVLHDFSNTYYTLRPIIHNCSMDTLIILSGHAKINWQYETLSVAKYI